MDVIIEKLYKEAHEIHDTNSVRRIFASLIQIVKTQQEHIRDLEQKCIKRNAKNQNNDIKENHCSCKLCVSNVVFYISVLICATL